MIGNLPRHLAALSALLFLLAVAVPESAEGSPPPPVPALNRIPGLLPWIDVGPPITNGGISRTDDHSERPSIAIDTKGNPVVAWQENRLYSGIFTATAGEIYLKRWEDGRWKEVGGSVTDGGISNTPFNILTGGHSVQPSVAVDPQTNEPVVAWLEGQATGPYPHVRRWNGSVWEELGGSATGAGIGIPTQNLGVFTCDAEIDAEGRIVVAWTQGVFDQIRPYVKRWDGKIWEELDGSGHGAGVAAGVPGTGGCYFSSMKLDRRGHPVVCWWRGERVGVIQVLHWNGLSWEGYGESATAAGIGGIPIPIPRSTHLSLGASDRPMVVWASHVGSASYDSLFLSAWNGTAWTGLNGSDSGRGLARPDFEYGGIMPDVATDPDGNPFVVWSQTSAATGTEYAIYLRWWNGSAWRELRNSVMAGLGTSPLRAIYPSVACGPSGTPFLAWQQLIPVGEEKMYDVVCRRWDPETPVDLTQARTAGTPLIRTGGVTPETSVRFEAPVISEFTAHNLSLQVELRPASEVLTGRPTAQGTPARPGSKASVIATDLMPRGYHWQARFVDQAGWSSPWAGYGGNLESEPDFTVIPGPGLSEDLEQLDALGQRLTVAGKTRDARIAFRSTIHSVIEQSILEVEVRPVDTPLSGTPVIRSAPALPGQRATAMWEGAFALGAYHWRARTVGSESGSASPWVDFGGNGPGQPDFERIPDPHLPEAICFSAAGIIEGAATARASQVLIVLLISGFILAGFRHRPEEP